MDRYLVESPHTPQNYVRALRLDEAAGYFTHFEWGCRDGVHCGWAIVEAESPSQALLAVPPFLREKARVVRLNRFDPADSPSLHRA